VGKSVNKLFRVALNVGRAGAFSIITRLGGPKAKQHTRLPRAP
jgi:hypothetical protein